jgi:hypothetical protein
VTTKASVPRILVLIPALAAVAAAASSCVLTTGRKTADPVPVLAGQPPLTAADMGPAFEFFTTDLPPDKAKAQIFKRHRLSASRGEYIIMKSAIGLKMLGRGGPGAAAVEAQYGTPLAVPSPSEMNLIRGLRANILRFRGGGR